jgi:hypothetical protein
MKFVKIYVEGQTEETFVRDVLTPHLSGIGVYPTPVLAKTKREKSGRAFKGGLTSYAKVRRDILRLLDDSSAAAVTTMLDFYGLPKDFPGNSIIPTGSPYDRVHYLQDELRKDIANPRFIPFLTLHEFEALLFVDPDEIESAFPDLRRRGVLAKEVKSFQTPEEIDEGKTTHPAARIKNHIAQYRKPLHGPLIVSRIGLGRIRVACPHFNGWLDQLEHLAGTNTPSPQP